MTDIARRTIEELQARYELEPELEDIFFEGVFDREVISSALWPTGTGRAIYEIETVDVPSALLLAQALTEGNKQRVIALARELATVEGNCAYRCLVDRDLDHWFGDLEATRGLRWSTYCAIELHFLSADVLRDIVVVTCKARIENFDIFLDSLTHTLSELYAMRLSDRKLALSLRWPPFESCLSSDGDRVLFALNEYQDKLLQSNGKAKLKTAFAATAQQFRQGFSDDCRHHIRGHDLVALLVWAIRKYRGIRELSSETALQRLLVLLARGVPGLREEVGCSP